MEEKEKTFTVYCTEYGEKFHLDFKCRFIEGKQLKKMNFPEQVPNSQYVGPCNYCSKIIVAKNKKNNCSKNKKNKTCKYNHKFKNYPKKEEIKMAKIGSFDADIEAFKESESYLEMGETSLNKCNQNKNEIIKNEKIDSENSNLLCNESSEIDFNNNKFSTKNKREKNNNENDNKLFNDNIIKKQSSKNHTSSESDSDSDSSDNKNSSWNNSNGKMDSIIKKDNNILDESSKIEESNKIKILAAIGKNQKFKNYSKNDNIKKQSESDEEHFTIKNNEETCSKIDSTNINNKTISENDSDNGNTAEKYRTYNNYMNNYKYNKNIGFSGAEIVLLETTNKSAKILNYNESWESNISNTIKDSSFDGNDPTEFGNYKFQFEIIPLENKINLQISVGFSIDYYSRDILFDNEKSINQSYETASYLKIFDITNKTGLINVIINISRGKLFVIGERELKLREERVFLTKENTKVLYRRNFLAISVGDIKRVKPIFKYENDTKNVEIKINNKTI